MYYTNLYINNWGGVLKIIICISAKTGEIIHLKMISIVFELFFPFIDFFDFFCINASMCA